jgi:iron complex transport system substrate-binding protein
MSVARAAGAAGLAIAAGLAPWAAQATPDMTGHDVVLASPPQKIADLWFAHNGVMVMLGAADRIVATVDRPKDQPWMFAIAPTLRKARWMPAQTPDIETLVHDGVQLVFIPQGEALRQECQAAGLPTAAMSFDSEEGLRRSVALTADMLGDPQAQAIARAYQQHLDEILKLVSSRVSDLPVEQRARVLHLQSLTPLKADGEGTLIDRWITVAGGRNAATGLHGNHMPITYEQILAWDPDVIILPGDAPDPESLPDHAAWDALRAVRSGLVYRNPKGVFPWDRYGPEFVLQVEWAAKLLHPGRFQDIDLNTATRDFYRTFYHAGISRDDADAILRAQAPAADRSSQ